MNFNARIRLIVDVPFQFDVDDTPPVELEPGPTGTQRLKDREAYEKAHDRIEEQRMEVAKHAEEIARSLKVKEGQIVDALVEGVEEA